jgi:hypothetical protein
LQCNDGTTSPTCRCRKVVQSSSGEDKLVWVSPELITPKPYSLVKPSKGEPKPAPSQLPDENDLKGRSPEEVEQKLKDRGLEGQPTRGGSNEGKRFPNPKKPGEQVRVMKGNPKDPDPAKRGPYARISKDGKVSEPIPLEGNPSLEKRKE